MRRCPSRRVALRRVVSIACVSAVGVTASVWAGPATLDAGAAGPQPFPSATATDTVDADRPPVAGDFDGDGRDDLLWYSGRPGVDALWYGTADRASAPLTINVGPGFAPVSGDFNGDGLDDLLWYEQAGSASTIIWYGAAGRAFNGAGGPGAPASARPVVGDINGDGADDVFFYNRSGPDALFYGSRGGFTVAPAAVGGDFANLVGDFDANGADDLVWYNASTGEGVLWFGGPTLAGIGLFAGPGFTLRAGDLNGDGADDLLWYKPGSVTTGSAIWYGQRNRSFAGSGVPGGGAFAPVIGDFDGNRVDDIFWYVPGTGPNYLWLDRAIGFTPYDAPGGVAGTPIVVDSDGDRSADILFAVDGAGAETWWYGVAPPAATPGLTVQTVASGLDHPWDLAFLPDRTMVFTERPGRLSVRLTDGTVRALSANLGDLFVGSETGLLGLAVDPSFASNRRIYTCQGATGPQIKVVAWQLDGGYTSATRVIDPVVGGIPLTSGRHGGCRLRFDWSGALLIGTGDAATGTNPQDLTSLGGKVLRVDPNTGNGAAGNPFLASANANTRRIWSFGHRNIQGMAIRSNGQLFTVEHGPDRDDEVNISAAGANYGWNPVPGYNEGVPMTFTGATPAAWSSGFPTVAPSGAAFLDGSQWGAWNGALAVATLKGQALRLQFYDGAGTLGGEIVPDALNGVYGRLRAAVVGPDGALYLTTDNGGTDRILRVSPR